MLESMLCTDDDPLVGLVACSTIPIPATIAVPLLPDSRGDLPAAENGMLPCAFADSAPPRDSGHDGTSTADRMLVPAANTSSTRDA